MGIQWYAGVCSGIFRYTRVNMDIQGYTGVYMGVRVCMGIKGYTRVCMHGKAGVYKGYTRV